MTNVQFQHMNAVAILIVIAFLIWFFYGPWKSLVIDIGRQNLFEIRDSLFLIAADGKISFEDPAYIAIRDRINGMIRFCESFSFLLLYFDGDMVQESKIPNALALVRSLPDQEVSLQIESKYKMALFIFILTMFFRSAWVVGISVFVLPIMALRNMLKGSRYIDKSISRFERKVEMAVVHGDAAIA